MLSAEVVIRNFIDFGMLSKITLMIKLNHNIFERSQAYSFKEEKTDRWEFAIGYVTILSREIKRQSTASHADHEGKNGGCDHPGNSLRDRIRRKIRGSESAEICRSVFGI